MKALILAENQYEDMELQYPKFRLREAGAEVFVAGPKSGESYSGKHGYPVKADLSFKDVNVSDFQALVIPGGYAPDRLRINKDVLEIVKKFHEQGKLIAFICHAGWVPISAGILNGITCTSYEAIKDDLVNAGVKWVDEPVVVYKNFITSRKPDDLPAFLKAIIEFLENKQ